MPEFEKPVSLPLATIEAIVTAANANAALSPESMERLRGWLSDQMTSAIRRARTRRLTKDDVKDLEDAYRVFRATINGLQDRTLPPPCIPEEWVAALDEWREIYQQFGRDRGAPPTRDWLLIGALVALYEAVSGEDAVVSADRNPTMQFLDAALSELVEHAPPELRNKLDWPNGEALKKQMPGLRRAAIHVAGRRLAKIIRQAGE